MSNDTKDPVDMTEAMAIAAGNSAADLIRQNWAEIDNILSGDKAKATVAISIKYKRAGNAIKQTFKISFAERHSDEREDTIDPAQLDLEGTK
jgi:hypothetical protein